MVEFKNLVRACDLQVKSVNSQFSEINTKIAQQFKLIAGILILPSFSHSNTFKFLSVKTPIISYLPLDNKKDIVDYSKVINQLVSDCLRTRDYEVDYTGIQDEITKIKYGLSDLNTNLNTTDNYIEKYLRKNLLSKSFVLVILRFSKKLQ